MAYLKSRFKNGSIIISLCVVVVCMGCVESIDGDGDGEGAYMLKLMNALKPPGWSNTTDMCEWRGVTCNHPSGRIEKIDLGLLSLTGTVPAGLNDSLSQLTFLALSYNNLSGPVPSLANLSFLQVAYLDNNNFTTIPHGCFHGLTTLHSLSLNNNRNLPPWNFPTDLTAHSSQLYYLDLSSTNLMGSLPPNISHSFPVMSRLYLSNNNLSSIPEGCFHNLTSLYGLSLANNTNLPPWTFPLHLTNSSFRLGILYLEATNLMGSLPNLSHFFPNLIIVALSNNNLTSIPQTCFQGLPGLLRLNLGNNTNLAPWTFPNLTHSTQLKELNLAATNLVDSLPEIFGSLPSLQTVLLSNNHLTGVLPKSFGGSKVVTLYLNHNRFSGTIDILSSMVDLSEAWLQRNSFEGPIPDLSRSTALLDLQLDHNQLTGVVSDSLAALPSLQSISLDNNFLQGPMPEVIFKLVGFSDNTTNGFCNEFPEPCDDKVTILLEIAAEFKYPILLARSWGGNNTCQNWSFIACDEKNKIRMVNLSNLKLTGTISPAFANLTDLRKLYLDGNNLTGEIPERLTRLPELEVVNVSNNHLDGNIPKFSRKVNFIATGNDFLVLPSNGSDHTPRPIPTALITGLSAASVGLLVICVVVIYKSKRLRKIMFKKTIVDRNVEDLIQSDGFMVQKRYSFSQVKKMTNSFSEKLGQGGFGVVYKRSLSDGRQVAVKILKDVKGNEVEFNGKEFINEVASINRTSHVNIVPFLGFCYETNKRALIYEFMPNGSLDKFIDEKASFSAVCKLDWSRLYQIIIGIAQGLEYLHWGCSTKILHLDIKPQNILLDVDFCPKIADFGLAKICTKKESIVSLQYARGTVGYIAPEVYNHGVSRVSHKSDVYSYGKLILEVIGGKENYNDKDTHTSEIYFTDWIYKELEQDTLPTKCLTNTENENDLVKKIILVSIWCIQKNPSNRPSIKRVIEMLEGPLDSIPFPPKPMWYSPQGSKLQSPDIADDNTHETDSSTSVQNDSINPNEFA